MRIYLDNCCFNRPYDDQSQIRISLEAQAKLQIQHMIREGKLELVTSYMLEFENAQNPYKMRREPISNFMNDYAFVYVSASRQKEIEEAAKPIMAEGIKFKDACHVACALYAKCDCFLTTDKRLLKFSCSQMRLLNPIDFFE